MIQLTRINHVPLVLNSDTIEHIDLTPDTVVTLINGQKFVVLETSEDVIRKVIEFRRAIYQNDMTPRSTEHTGESTDQRHG